MAEADLVVIGCGPAGMSAAIQASSLGLSVILLDEQDSAGGQIYRAVEEGGEAKAKVLGKDYVIGARLAEDLQDGKIQRIKRSIVWYMADDGTVSYKKDGCSSIAKGRRVLIATGALERSMPIPGWTLPGVMTAGAAQILLKQSGLVFSDAVIAGSGPLLYLVAAQMCRAGKPPKALVETQTAADFMASQRFVVGAIRGWKYLAKGLGLLLELQRAKVKRYKSASKLHIDGKNYATALNFIAGGREHQVACSTILLHHGVIPNTQASRALGIEHRWNHRQRSFDPVKNEWGQTSKESYFIAGDGGGIGGAQAAECSGSLASIQVAFQLGRISRVERDSRAKQKKARLNRELAARPFIDRAYPPFREALSPANETVICRCEEVTAGDIRGYAEIGCLGPNQTKAFGRCGMGPCQGRYCGLSVTELLAEANQTDHDVVGYYRIRAPLKPVSLGELAALTDTKKDSVS